MASASQENPITVYTYIMANFRKHKFRYGLTIFGMIICIIFFIIIASLSIGIYEPTEPEIATDEVTQDELFQHEDTLELDDNVKRTIVNWLYLTSVLIFATAVAGVANTILMSMVERKREIGILKSVGFTQRKIMEIFLTESFMICMIAFVIGVVAGVHLANNIFNYLGEGGEHLFFGTMRTPPVVILAAFIIVFVVGLLAGILPARRAAKLTPVDALKG